MFSRVLTVAAIGALLGFVHLGSGQAAPVRPLAELHAAPVMTAQYGGRHDRHRHHHRRSRRHHGRY